MNGLQTTHTTPFKSRIPKHAENTLHTFSCAFLFPFHCGTYSILCMSIINKRKCLCVVSNIVRDGQTFYSGKNVFFVCLKMGTGANDL